MKRFKSIMAAAALGSLAVSQAVAAAPAAQPAVERSGSIAGQADELAGGFGGAPAWLLAATALAGGLFIWAVVDDDEDGLPAPVSP